MMIILLLSPFIMLSCHMILARLNRSRPAQAIALLAVALSLLVVCTLFYAVVWRSLALGERSAVLLYCCIVFFCLAMFYFHLFNTSETARRIKLLYEIHKAGMLSESAITRLYSVDDVVRLRLKRLVETNQLEFREGYYMLKGKLLYRAAFIVLFWQLLLRMPSVQPAQRRSGAEGNKG